MLLCDEHPAKKDRVEGIYPLENPQIAEGPQVPSIPHIAASHFSAECSVVGLNLRPLANL